MVSRDFLIAIHREKGQSPRFRTGSRQIVASPYGSEGSEGDGVADRASVDSVVRSGRAFPFISRTPEEG